MSAHYVMARNITRTCFTPVKDEEWYPHSVDPTSQLSNFFNCWLPPPESVVPPTENVPHRGQATLAVSLSIQRSPLGIRYFWSVIQVFTIIHYQNSLFRLFF